MEQIKINKSNINDVVFADDVQSVVKKQITTIPAINDEGKIEPMKLEYGIQFNVNGSTLKHALHMATLNSKTDIGNNFRTRAKRDVEEGHNDTFDFFNSLLDENGVLVVSGFPTGLPDVPETPEQRKRMVTTTMMSLDEKERKELLAELQKLG